MNKNLVSFVVPVYGVEKYIKKCVDSILNQTYEEFELILVDDGSKDNCPSICDEYAKNDKRVKVIHKQNQGLMAAWIDGVKNSSGNYIYFVDADDFVELDSLENYIRVIDEYNPDMIINDFYQFYDTYKTITKGVENFEVGYYDGELLTNIKKIYFWAEKYIFHPRWNKIFKKELVIQNLKYCDTRVSILEDLNIFMPVFADIKSLYMMDKPGYNYWIHSESMLRSSFNEKNIANYEYVLNFIINILKDKGLFNESFISERAYMYLIELNNRILNSKCNRNDMFEKVRKSFLINNPYRDIIFNRFSKKRKLIYKAFVNGNFKFYVFLIKLMNFKQSILEKKPRKIYVK